MSEDIDTTSIVIDGLNERLQELEDRLRESSIKRERKTTGNKRTVARGLWPAFNRENALKDAKQLLALKEEDLIPKAVTGLRGAITVVTVNGRTMNRLSVRWVAASDSNYDGARVWLRGYQTDNELGIYGAKAAVPWVLLAEVQDSPYTTNLEATGEEVMVTVQALNKNRRGADLKTLPTKTFILTLVPGSPQPLDTTQTTLY